MSELKIQFEGLNALDAEELKAVMGSSGLELDEPAVPEGTLAEPATITAILALGPTAIATLALWLSKGRRGHVLRHKAKIIHPDGRVEEQSWEIKDTSEAAVKSQVISKLGKWIGASSAGAPS